jgi:hypothetical protein
VAALIGLHPANPADRYILHTAVRGARILGWPEPDVQVAEPAQ